MFVIEKVAQLAQKVRDTLKETLIENARKSNFIRIYPTRSSDIYDRFFAQTKPQNALLHKLLFTDEIVPFPDNYV